MAYYLVNISYSILFVAVFARQLCIPVPALLFLLSAGALASSGKLSYIGSLVTATLGCVLADFIWFELGRLRGKRILRLLCALASDPRYCIRKARTSFASRGLKILLIAKFVPGLDGICPPLAGIAGASKFDFIIYDAIGAALWSGTYLTCGFIFGKELKQVAHYTSVIANSLILILGIPLLILCAWKLTVLIRIARILRSRQISPEGLKARLEDGEKVGVVDLLLFEDDAEGVEGIPGAVRLDPRELAQKRKVVMPPGLDLVLYCRSTSSFASMRVAVVMRRHGIDSIYVLRGGLAAWKSSEFPVSHNFASPEEALARLKIEVDPPWRVFPMRER